MNISTIYIIIELFVLLLPIATALYRILTLHIQNSTKIDLVLHYLDSHEQRLLELEKLIQQLSKGAGK